jgi:hypothetical protein
MGSLKQLEANRLNALKSTGPRSVEGKKASSQNALKSGIDAESHIIRGENPANLQSLRDEYYNSFHPTTPEQRMLVDVLIDSEWLLRRFRTVEAQLWEEGAASSFRSTPAVELAKAFRATSSHFDRLQRRINHAQRNYRTALADLRKLQAEPPQPLPEEIGFVPQSPDDAPPAPLPDLPDSPLQPQHPDQPQYGIRVESQQGGGMEVAPPRLLVGLQD